MLDGGTSNITRERACRALLYHIKKSGRSLPADVISKLESLVTDGSWLSFIGILFGALEGAELRA